MDTVAIEIERDAAGRFVAGQSGNPAGKRPGTRNRKTILLEALRDGEDAAVARVVIEKALSGHVATARFVLGLISPKPRGRTIHLPMPADDNCNVVTAFNVTLRLLCEGEITPDEALTVSRFLDGRRRALQAWQLEEHLTSYGREIPGDPPVTYDDEDEEDVDAADTGDAADDSDGEAPAMRADPPMRAAAPTAAAAGAMPSPEPAPPAAAAASADEPAQPAAPVMAGEAASPARLAEAAAVSQPEAASLQTSCISRSPGTIRGMIQIPAGGLSALDSALAASIARRLAARSAAR